LTPSRAATATLLPPCAQASTIRARKARPCAVRRRLAQFSNVCRSSSDNTSGANLGSGISPAHRTLGHTSKMRWNPADKWVFSEQIAHPPVIGTEDFELAQQAAAIARALHEDEAHRQADLQEVGWKAVLSAYLSGHGSMINGNALS
jgi:hypothetical protein